MAGGDQGAVGSQQPKEKDKDKDNASRENFLKAKNTARIREFPGGPKKNFGFKKTAIKNAKRTEYLLLGFDTEYQTLEDSYDNDAIREGKAKYEVLSYQFHAINSSGAEWNGIAIPDSDGRRLTFTEFMVYAISKGVLLGEDIPKTIVLVGHYTRADVPAFEDRDQLFWQLNNVRNSLVSLGPSYQAACPVQR